MEDLNKKIKRLEIQSRVAIFLCLGIFIFGSFLVYSIYSKQNAEALEVINYSKVEGGRVEVADWNRLKDDFVAKGQDIGMANHRIVNLADPVGLKDAVNKEYVDKKMVNADYLLTHAGSNGAAVDCSAGAGPGAGYVFKTRVCVASNANCISDVCLWVKY